MKIEFKNGSTIVTKEDGWNPSDFRGYNVNIVWFDEVELSDSFRKFKEAKEGKNRYVVELI